ncbi:hypothetical protein [Nakamurella leprariae]|uniref:Uncharacterized protein n=1 Tax=Nakamurella leprariae TaxID=2803911 RepID=A0A938YHD1_9ACTN|nr:hypothetical protein [Nakamurella leprariae]MBM9469633.1 hypothetical protein [Nakamurella leprariae]
MAGDRGWIQPQDPLVGCLTGDQQLYIVPGSADGAVCAAAGLHVVDSDLPFAPTAPGPTGPVAPPSITALPAGTTSASCFKDAASTAAGPDTGDGRQSYGVTLAYKAGKPAAMLTIQDLQDLCRQSMTAELHWIGPGDPLVGCLGENDDVFVIPGTSDGAVCASLDLPLISATAPYGTVSVPSPAPVPASAWGAICHASSDPARSDESELFEYGDALGTSGPGTPTLEQLLDICQQTMARNAWPAAGSPLVGCLDASGMIRIYPDDGTGSGICAALGLPQVVSW